MLRNREFQIYLGASMLVALLGAGMAVIFFPPVAGLVVLAVAAVMAGFFIVFTKWRYREIEKLSGYLRRISSGEYSLDVRDMREGELSILKNEIYKVTRMLSEHRSLLQQEKVNLTNAISDISHQLKTPLTSMTVMADLLEDANLDEKKRAEFTGNIQTQLERLDWLVSSLLKLSKIDAGTVKFKKDKVSVRRLIDKAAEPFLIPMDIKAQTLKISGDESASFIGDLNWTTEAVVNILKNCIEHTGEGGEISIRFSENALFTEIIISDNGKGIAKEDLPYIFKRFYKGKNAGEDSVGIGLAMAHSIISGQKGDISVVSKEGEGTSFRIKFYKQVI